MGGRVDRQADGGRGGDGWRAQRWCWPQPACCCPAALQPCPPPLRSLTMARDLGEEVDDGHHGHEDCAHLQTGQQGRGRLSGAARAQVSGSGSAGTGGSKAEEAHRQPVVRRGLKEQQGLRGGEAVLQGAGTGVMAGGTLGAGEAATGGPLLRGCWDPWATAAAPHTPAPGAAGCPSSGSAAPPWPCRQGAGHRGAALSRVDAQHGPSKRASPCCQGGPAVCCRCRRRRRRGAHQRRRCFITSTIRSGAMPYTIRSLRNLWGGVGGAIRPVTCRAAWVSRRGRGASACRRQGVSLVPGVQQQAASHPPAARPHMVDIPADMSVMAVLQVQVGAGQAQGRRGGVWLARRRGPQQYQRAGAGGQQ